MAALGIDVPRNSNQLKAEKPIAALQRERKKTDLSAAID